MRPSLRLLCCATLMAAGAAVAAPAAAQDGSRCGGHLWCDASQPPDTRARMVLASMTPEEKFELMGGQLSEDGNSLNQAIPRLGIPAVGFKDGPQGLRSTDGAGPMPSVPATALPAPIALAASWDAGLAEGYGGLVGREATKRGADVVLGPTLNIARTPLGGRTFESYGEDPLLMARMGVGFIEGLQAEGVVADAKHYAANNQETNRLTANSVVDERTLREIYLPHFEAAVTQARAGTVMLAYNRTNGEYMTENGALVDGLLKDEWAFEGFALSDYGAQKTTVGAANNGLDLELPQALFYRAPPLSVALASGQVSQATIDEHVLRILRVMFRFGMFDRPAYPKEGAVDVARHGAFAREVSEQGSVLLKNERGALPLGEGRVRSIALIGEDADTYRSGGLSASVEPFYRVTVREGIAQRAARSGIEVRYDPGTDRARAAAVARSADIAVAFASDSPNEQLDKPCLALECTQQADGNTDQDGLIEAVAAANPNTIVVLQTGAPVLMPWIGDVRAVLEAWYPGQEGGNAIAAVLFGDVDPGGRLPITFPVRELDPPTAGRPERYPGVAENVAYSEGIFVGYRHYDEHEVEPLFAFGHGLSYTRFRYRGLRVERAGDGAAVSAVVANAGDRPGSEVPQLYLGMPDPTPGVEQPPSWLRGFDKVRLAPGETRRVRFRLDPRALSYWDAASDRWAVAPGCYQIMVGASSRDLRLRGDLGIGARHSVAERRLRVARGRRTFRLRLSRGGRPVGGATVRVAGPGFSRVARTDREGRARITVVARRRGTARASAAACADRLRASAARPRRSGSRGRRSPALTG